MKEVKRKMTARGSVCSDSLILHSLPVTGFRHPLKPPQFLSSFLTPPMLCIIAIGAQVVQGSGWGCDHSNSFEGFFACQGLTL